MKYVISDNDELVMGEGCYHADLAHAFTGRVTGAGHVAFRSDGSFTLVGKSVGYNLRPTPEDGELIARITGLRYIPPDTSIQQFAEEASR